MRSALAIGAVTAVIRSLLVNRLADVYSELGENTPDVSVLPPDLVISTDATNPDDALNLFLYQLTPNSGWRNVDYPARNSQGDRVSYPPLALDLHYLLSAYSQVSYRAEIMLGNGMQVLHETGILSRQLITNVLANFNNSPENTLVDSTLAEQIETIKITPEVLSSEEISKLWGAFQTNYRPTVAYHVSVVLIESERSARSTLPVTESRLFVLPFKRPVIDGVQPQIVAPGETLTIKGYNLKADELRVKFSGGIEVSPPLANITEREITLDSSELPTDLQTGVKTLQIVHYLNYEPDEDNPPDLRESFESNTFPFIWQPQINSIPPQVTRGTALNISVESPVGQRQRVSLLLGDRVISGADINDAVPTDIGIEIPADFPPGTYLVRIRIDGAESQLQSENGVYNAPTIEVTL